MERKKLSDILYSSDRDRLETAWKEAHAAEDFGPLPAGEYDARLSDGTATTARTGTPGYKFTFKVLEGDYAGRLFWHDLWLTPAAMPLAKRDLGKLGVTSLAQLDHPLPQGIRCKVKLVVHRDDGGKETNRVRAFEVLGVDLPVQDPFAPGDAAEPTTAEGEEGESSFPFGANAETDGPYREGR